jgi:hypothetical protein
MVTMSEFANRIDIQRSIIRIINSSHRAEDLFGLSRNAIRRWVVSNGIAENTDIVRLLLAASEGLNLLANKSQEQISEEYQEQSREVLLIVSQLKAAVKTG